MSKFLIVSFVIHIAFIKQKELLLTNSPLYGRLSKFLEKQELQRCSKPCNIFDNKSNIKYQINRLYFEYQKKGQVTILIYYKTLQTIPDNPSVLT